MKLNDDIRENRNRKGLPVVLNTWTNSSAIDEELHAHMTFNRSHNTAEDILAKQSKQKFLLHHSKRYLRDIDKRYLLIFTYSKS